MSNKKKYLDFNGLSSFWTQAKGYIDSKSSEAPTDNKPYVRKDGEWVNMHDQYENEDIAILIADVMMNRKSYTITQEEYNKFTTICPPGNVAYAHLSYDALKIAQPDATDADIMEMYMFGDKGLFFKITNIDGDLLIYANTSYYMYQGHYLFALSISPDLTFRKSSGYGYITGEGNGAGENYLHIADVIITQGPDGDEYSNGVATLISGGDGTKFLSNSGEYKQTAYIIDWIDPLTTSHSNVSLEKWDELTDAINSGTPIYLYYNGGNNLNICGAVSVNQLLSSSIGLAVSAAPIGGGKHIVYSIVLVKNSTDVKVTIKHITSTEEAPADDKLYARKNNTWVEAEAGLGISKIEAGDDGTPNFDNVVDEFMCKLWSTSSKSELPVSLVKEVRDYATANVNGQFAGMDSYNYFSAMSINGYGTNPFVSICLGEGDGKEFTINTHDMFGYQYFMKGDGHLTITLNDNETDYDLYGAVTAATSDLLHAYAHNEGNTHDNAISYFFWDTANNVWHDNKSFERYNNIYICDFLNQETITEEQFKELSDAVMARKTIFVNGLYDKENTTSLGAYASLTYHYGPEIIAIKVDVPGELTGKSIGNIVITVQKNEDVYTVTQLSNIFNLITQGNGNKFLSNDGSYRSCAVGLTNTAAANLAIEPNLYYKWGEMTSLSITLKAGNDYTCNEYMFEFKSGATPTTLSLPDSIKWVSEPSIEPNKTYQVSILNNVGIIVGCDL